MLIFDEVITGFRIAYGGAQTLYEVTPDITCLGKIIGGGLPVGGLRRATGSNGDGRAAGADVPGRDFVRKSFGGYRRVDYVGRVAEGRNL